MKQVILWIWCLPQNLLGLIFRICSRVKRIDDHYLRHGENGSFSLGEYIVLSVKDARSAFVLAHERGHRKQSRILGWLYLPVVGIPSVVWYWCFEWYRKRYGTGYYEFYTERWANSLEGIKDAEA